jgi:transcriptional regulator with XRE-family HTH domain
MLLNMRIRVVRHSLKFSQSALAASLRVSRSAIANWEGGLATPTAGNLLTLAELANVSFEWLALNRGSMKLAPNTQSIPAVDALLIYEADELQLIHAYRSTSGRQRIRLLQLAEAYLTKPHGTNASPKRSA